LLQRKEGRKEARELDETEDEKRTQGNEKRRNRGDSIAFLHFVEIEDLDFKK
jgi:hypothetical protein